MFRKSIITLIAASFILLPLTMALAEGPGGKARKGKYLYRKVCTACFNAGGVESATPTVSPADKKKAEWKDIFENKKLDEFGCSEQWAAVSDKDLLDIYTYFYSYAADSPKPATCK